MTDKLLLKKKKIIITYLQLWVAYAPCGSQHKDAIQITLEQIDLIKRFVEQYQDTLEFVTSSDGRSRILADTYSNREHRMLS